MRTRLTQILGTETPIIQGGMAWVAEHNLAAAVSNAGGLGLIGAASAPAEVVREEVRKCKELTDKPFGVNIMLLNPNADDVAQIVIEEGVKVVTTGAGNPSKYMAAWKEAGVKVIPVVASVAMARLMERAGADAVDYKLISICHKGDVVVSQDYGVAAMALGKGAYAIHQSGKWYTNENIDQMLMERHLNKKVRRSSHKNHMKGPRKRTEEDDVRFAQSFEKLILMAKSKEGAQSGTI